MGKKDKDFKFIVGKQGERSSKVWSVKVRKSDVYIMNAQGKQHKISLHKSIKTLNRFNNFPQREYTEEDIRELEKLLLKR